MSLTLVVGDVLLHHLLVAHPHFISNNRHRQNRHHQHHLHHLPEAYQLLLLCEALRLLQRRVHELIQLHLLSKLIQ